MKYTNNQNLALLMLRVTTSAIFFVAGFYKFFFWSHSMEGMSAAMANLMKFLSIVEPLGALAVLAGFLTRWAATGLSIILLGAIYVTKFSYHTGFVTPTGPGWEFPLSVLCGCIILLAFGPGNWAVDGRVMKNRV